MPPLPGVQARTKQTRHSRCAHKASSCQLITRIRLSPPLRNYKTVSALPELALLPSSA